LRRTPPTTSLPATCGKVLVGSGCRIAFAAARVRHYTHGRQPMHSVSCLS
jgi:hypothetical protein